MGMWGSGADGSTEGVSVRGNEAGRCGVARRYDKWGARGVVMWV